MINVKDIVNLMSDIRSNLSRNLAGFRPLAKATVIFLVSNVAVFAILSLRPDLVGWLWLSADRPWGIVTSAFTHVDLDHIFGNVEGFMLSVLLFLTINLVYNRRARRRVSTHFLLLIFVAGIGANLLEYPLALSRPGDHSWGASGVVYGALGVAFASALSTLPVHLSIIAKDRRRRAGKSKRRLIFSFDRHYLRTFPSLLALSLSISVTLMLILDAGSFLNVAPGVDVFAHGVGFLLGFLGFNILAFIDKRRAGKVALRRALRGQDKRP